LEMKGNTLAIVLLVVGLVVGAGAGYFLAPSGDGGDGGDGGTVTVEVAPLEGKNIQLGYISSTTVGLETTVPLVDEILTPDYNAYLAKLGMDTTMEYLIDDATGQAAVHLEKVQGYKSMDINVFIGGGWSSQAQAALSYCNDNDMLMWSSSSTSPLLAIADDNLLRMCPDDTIQAPAIAEMLVSHGIHAIILIYRGDAWADGIYNYLEPAYTQSGGVIVEKIRYAGEATEFSNYLQTAEGIAVSAVAEYGAEHVGVEIISFAEFVVMMTQAQDYPTLYDLVWFGSDGTTLSQQACDDSPVQVEHLKVHSTFAAPAESSKFNDLYDRYYALVSQPFGYYSACSYDIGWVLTESIMNSQSLDATVLIPIQHDTAFNNFGARGWTQLNAAGDRYGSNYQIWSYHYVGDVVKPYVSGLYDGITGKVTWYLDAIGYVPPSW
jgi:branched-chain amino acid transport system substrate-binding protein